MLKFFLALLGIVFVAQAHAADNVGVLDWNATHIALRCHDLGGSPDVQTCQYVPGDASGNVCVSVAGSTPACYIGTILSTGNGATSDHYINAGGGDTHNVGSNSAKLLVGGHLSNIAPTIAVVKFYNKQGCASSDTPIMSVVVPGNVTGAGRELYLPPMGKAFSTALCTRIVTGLPDNDTGSVTAATVAVDLDYY